MSKTKPVETQQETAEDVPAVAPEAEQQVAVREASDVDPRTGTRVIIGVPERSDEEEVQDLIVWLQQRADEGSQDAMARIAESLRKASSATSVAELLREPETVSGKDFVGIPFWATGFDVHSGEYEGDGLPFFISLNARQPDTGEPFIANCGGEKILPYMQWLDAHGKWPLLMCFTGKQTRKKRVVLGIDILQESE